MTERLLSYFREGLYRGPSPIHGQGVFTSRRIKRGRVVMVWGGLVIPCTEYDPAIHRAASTTRYDVDHYLTALQTDPETLDPWLNHACDANTWMLDEVALVARRDIDAGAEITTDFALWGDPGYVYTESCRCGSKLCRGRVTGDDGLRHEVEERYRGGFIPWLNERFYRG